MECVQSMGYAVPNLNSLGASGKTLLKHLAEVGPQHRAARAARCKARERARPARKNAMTGGLSQTWEGLTWHAACEDQGAGWYRYRCSKCFVLRFHDLYYTKDVLRNMFVAHTTISPFLAPFQTQGNLSCLASIGPFILKAFKNQADQIDWARGYSIYPKQA